MAIPVTKIQEMRRERRRLVEQAGQKLPQDRDPTPEEYAEHQRLHDEANNLLKKIEAEERQLDAENALHEEEARGRESRGVIAGRPDSDGKDPTEDPEQRAAAVAEARRTWYRYGVPGLSPEQRRVLTLGRIDDMPAEVRAMASGFEGGGGVLVGPESLQPITEAKRAYGGLLDAGVEIITTTHGRDIPFPLANDTMNRARIVGENRGSGAEKLPVLGSETIRAYTYTTDPVVIPFELLDDTDFPLEGWVFGLFGERLARTQNEHGTNRVDSGGPRGFVPRAKVGVTAPAGQVDSVTVDDFINLEHEVDRNYRASPSCRYMFADSTLCAAKKLKNDNGDLMWVPGVALRAPDTINGHRYVVNDDMDTLGAGKKPMAFGDFRSIKVRIVSGRRIIRILEKYAEEGQVALIMFERFDCTYLNPGSDPIKLFQCAA